MILPHFDLPELHPVPHNGQTSVAHSLAQYYMAILQPFEEAYKRNLQEQQRRAAMSAARQPGSQPPQLSTPTGRPLHPPKFSDQIPGAQADITGLMNQTAAPSSSLNGSSYYPQAPLHQRPPSSAPNVPSHNPANREPPSAPQSDFASPVAQISNGVFAPQLDKNILDPDVQDIKRKLDFDKTDGKRVRQRIG
jgi:SWI/SNF chromatin-remodeling complex subunit SWI1